MPVKLKKAPFPKFTERFLPRDKATERHFLLLSPFFERSEETGHGHEDRVEHFTPYMQVNFEEKLQQHLLIFTRGNVSLANFACSALWHNEDVKFRTFTVCVRFNTNRAVLAFKRLSKVSLTPRCAGLKNL